MLEVKKIYVDTRFKTADSRSDSDFYIDLPKTVNITDTVKCYIDDIVMPISFKVVELHNNNLYFSIYYFNGTVFTTIYCQITLTPKNYNGITLSAILKTLMNAQLTNDMNFSFDVTYDITDNILSIHILDEREEADKIGVVAIVHLISDYDLINTMQWGTMQNRDNIKTLNQILRITKTIAITNNEPYEEYIDLHTIRNLYMHSSALGSYNIISNFGQDTIIKKIPITSNFNEMLFDGVRDGFDCIDLTRRSLNRIDFKLTDSFGNIINLNRNHFSFSIVFVPNY